MGIIISDLKATIDSLKKQKQQYEDQLVDVVDEIEYERSLITQYKELSSELITAVSNLGDGRDSLEKAIEYFEAGYEGTGYGADYINDMTTAKEQISEYYNQLLECYNAAIEKRDEHQQLFDDNCVKKEELEGYISDLEEKIKKKTRELLKYANQ